MEERTEKSKLKVKKNGNIVDLNSTSIVNIIC